MNGFSLSFRRVAAALVAAAALGWIGGSAWAEDAEHKPTKKLTISASFPGFTQPPAAKEPGLHFDLIAMGFPVPGHAFGPKISVCLAPIAPDEAECEAVCAEAECPESKTAVAEAAPAPGAAEVIAEVMEQVDPDSFEVIWTESPGGDAGQAAEQSLEDRRQARRDRIISYLRELEADEVTPEQRVTHGIPIEGRDRAFREVSHPEGAECPLCQDGECDQRVARTITIVGDHHDVLEHRGAEESEQAKVGLREASAQLDQVANQLEHQHLWHAADEIRELAQGLRIQARGERTIERIGLIGRTRAHLARIRVAHPTHIEVRETECVHDQACAAEACAAEACEHLACEHQAYEHDACELAACNNQACHQQCEIEVEEIAVGRLCHPCCPLSAQPHVTERKLPSLPSVRIIR